MQAVETESIGNSRAGSTFRRVEVRRVGKEEEEADPNAQRGHTADDLCLSATHPSVSIFPTGYIPTHSPTPPTSTLRAARAHDADLLIYSFTVPP